MANNNNIDGTITTNNTQLLGNGYTLPSDFNNSRQPGELASLFNANSNVIYNKFSAKTGHVNSLLKFGPRQPFISFNPNTGTKGINALKGAVPSIGAPLQDVERITKWQLTGNGVIFIAKQFLLQGQNAFNETKIYNPLLPILSTVSKASFGAIPTPTRHLDLSAGFSSILGFGSAPKAPKTTVGANNSDAVSYTAKLAPNAYKGLLRGVTATSGYHSIKQKWEDSNKKGGFGAALKGYFASQLNSIFGTLIPVGQPNDSIYRADESTYGKMLVSTNKFKHSLLLDGVLQRWIPGNEIRKGAVLNKYARFAPFISNGKFITFDSTKGNINGKQFGVPDFTDENTNGTLYGDFIGYNRWVKDGGNVDSLEYSDQVVNYAYYTDKLKTDVKPDYFKKSKLNDINDLRVKSINDNLKNVITNLQKPDVNANNTKYELNSDNGYKYTPLSQFNEDANTFGMDYIDKVTGIYSKQFSYYNADRFVNTRTIDPVPNATSNNKTYGFAGTNRSDRINTIGVLTSDNFGDGKQNYDQYDPTTDDVVTFYFHDIVNDKYLPFRSALKGISESSTAEWNDISYLGRADKLYNYKGFTRTLSFNFLINISSIKEFAPTWQKINYFMGLVKPANYTANNNYPSFSRFVIPPFVEFTIGDMYVDQPSVITSIGFSIPEDSSWETLNENFSKSNDWTYLHNVIKWTDSKNKYAQLPRTVDLSVSLNLLEKEKPIIGGAQFGSSYRDLNYTNLKNAGTFSSKLIV